MNFQEGVRVAEKRGHVLDSDPPVFSSMQRKTCKHCGCSVIGNHQNAYGSAIEQTCSKPQSLRP